jgi:hypothetical protein
MSAFGICLEFQVRDKVNFIAEKILGICGEK